MTTKKSFTKLIICLLLILALFPIGYATTVYATKDDEEEIEFSIEDLINQNGEGSENSQELTSGLGLNMGFESGSTEGWTIPTFAETEIIQVGVADFTDPDGAFAYGDGMINYTTIGTDGTDGNRFGLLFLLNDSGIAGIESPEITIPAHAYYVLTFNVKVAELGNSGTNYGINAKLIDQATGDIVAMDAIKTESEDYVTYAFLIQGNEFSETKVKLQLLFGNAVETDGVTTKSNQIGYAAVDTLRLFSVTYEQFSNLTEDDNGQQASYLTQNSNYVFIDNGYFNVTENQNWNLNNYTALSDLRPLNWSQSQAGGETDWGIINTNQTIFETIIQNLGLSATNPNNADGSSIENSNNNVLMLSNQNGYQTITSSEIVLTKNKYYEIQFKFNTQANQDQTNPISFYIIDSDDRTIYSKDNVFSYVEYSSDSNEWATFHAFIKVDGTDKKVNFIIEFGTEESPTTGVAFIDDVRLITKSSASSVFVNNEENKYVLKAEEGQTETSYLPTGAVTFDDLLNLDQTAAINRDLVAFSYDIPEETTPEDPDDNGNEDTPSADPSIAWYIVPSILLAVALIAGIVLYYVKKIKIKKPSKKSKNQYDRNKTLNKQVEKREREQKALEKQNLDAQLEQVRSEISALEEEYEGSKKAKTHMKDLKVYLAKRQKLQNKEAKILEQIEKLSK